MRPTRHLILTLSLVALPALLVAGCGGGGDSTTDSTAKEATEATPSLSKEALIKQGDAICGEVNAAIGSVGSSAADASSQTSQVAGLYVGMVTRLEELGEPTEDATEYADFMAAAKELSKVEGEIKLAAEREDTAALGEAATEAAPALEEFQAQAAIFGFEQCSQPPSAPPVAPSTSSEGEVEEGGVEAEGEIEEVVPEEEFVPEEEEIVPETGGAGGEIEEVVPETGGGGGEESSGGGVGPG